MTENSELLRSMHAESMSVESHDVVPHNPDRVAEELGVVLPYFRDVEWLVHQYAKDLDVALGPDSFRDRWLEEEVQHGLIIDAMLHNSGIDSELPEIQDEQLGFRVMGWLSSRSATFDSMLRLTANRTGYINEKTNMIGQRNIIKKLKEIDEPGLARTFGAMARQERRHGEYYYEEANRVQAGMGRHALRGADYMLVRNFTPVGANDLIMKRRFGEVMDFLGSLHGIDKFETDIKGYIAEIVAPDSDMTRAQKDTLESMYASFIVCIEEYNKIS